jgi:hypothetical protein
METALWTRDDRGADGLEPDLMLPEQFFGALRRNSSQNGERRLMAAVLQEGIETFQKYAHARDPEGRELFDDARAWIVARHDQDLFSFTTVCAVLDIDAECVRGGLMRWLDRHRVRQSDVAIDLSQHGDVRHVEHAVGSASA